jgi:predicted DNA-binding protein YlxM (UPF0122 family)
MTNQIQETYEKKQINLLISRNQRVWSNKSLQQIQKEINIARKQALRPNVVMYKEITDTITTDTEGYTNSLIDMVNEKELTLEQAPSHVRTVPPHVKKRIDQIFAKFPKQLEYLGLYYAAAFTYSEIADMKSIAKNNVKLTVQRGVKRLKDKLTEQEYDSIRWLLRDYKPIRSTVKKGEWDGYIDSYSCQGNEIINYRKTVQIGQGNGRGLFNDVPENDLYAIEKGCQYE